MVADTFDDMFEMGAEKIDCGAQGSIYIGKCKATGEEVVMKIEEKSGGGVGRGIELESKIYNLLQDEIGFPKVWWVGGGVGRRDASVMVMDRLGPSLEAVLEEAYLTQRLPNCPNDGNVLLSLKTVLMLADQLIARVETLHSKGFIHLDLKPGNIMMGRGENSGVVHLIDFGISWEYRDPITHTHKTFDYKSVDHPTPGSPTYAHTRLLFGEQPSRRDDLWSVLYILIFLLRGRLPWEEFSSPFNPDDIFHVLANFIEHRLRFNLTDLTADTPIEFVNFGQYLLTLDHESEPDYGYLRRLMKELFHRKGFRDDGLFDWMHGGVSFKDTPWHLMDFHLHDWRALVPLDLRVDALLPRGMRSRWYWLRYCYWHMYQSYRKCFPGTGSGSEWNSDAPVIVTLPAGEAEKCGGEEAECTGSGEVAAPTSEGEDGSLHDSSFVGDVNDPVAEHDIASGVATALNDASKGEKKGMPEELAAKFRLLRETYEKQEVEEQRAALPRGREQRFEERFGKLSVGAHHSTLPVDLNMCDTDRIQMLEGEREKLVLAIDRMTAGINQCQNGGGADRSQLLAEERQTLALMVDGITVEIRERLRNINEKREEMKSRYVQNCLSLKETMRTVRTVLMPRERQLEAAEDEAMEEKRYDEAGDLHDLLTAVKISICDVDVSIRNRLLMLQLENMGCV